MALTTTQAQRLRCSQRNGIHPRQHSVIVGAGLWYAGGLVTLARQHRPHLSGGVGGHQSLLSNCSSQPGHLFSAASIDLANDAQFSCSISISMMDGLSYMAKHIDPGNQNPWIFLTIMPKEVFHDISFICQDTISFDIRLLYWNKALGMSQTALDRSKSFPDLEPHASRHTVTEGISSLYKWQRMVVCGAQWQKKST